MEKMDAKSGIVGLLGIDSDSGEYVRVADWWFRWWELL